MSDSDRTVFLPRTGLAPGVRLNGIYEIERLIATGGMGEVYQGRAIQTGDAVAIKIVRSDVCNPVAAQRFRTERQILAALDHRPLGVGELGNGPQQVARGHHAARRG